MSDRSMFGPEWTVSPTGNGNEHHLFDSRGKVAATGYKGEKLQYIADCVNRVAELEAIVARHPRTADGVPVVPGMEVWVRSGCGSVGSYKGMYDDGYGICVISHDGERIPLMRFDNDHTGQRAQIYSTPQAAEEASKP